MNLSPHYSLNCRGRFLPLDRPRLMGILNVTPDSFSDGGLYDQPARALQHAETMLAEGADIIDIGGYSSRPYAIDISVEEEIQRILPVIQLIRERIPTAILSIDTFRSAVAREALAHGAHIINDISGGSMDPEMIPLVGSFGNVPYVLMHMKGTPQTMQVQPSYEAVMQEIWMYFVEKIPLARKAGIKDLILDPGFGFGKTISHNYQILHQLDQLTLADCPLLVGLSRKSLLYRILDTTPNDVLASTQVLHDHALRKGAMLLRVHDVKEAKRTITLYQRMRQDEIV